MTSYKRVRTNVRTNNQADVGKYGIDLSCLDRVDEVVIQRLIQEFGLTNCRELPDLKNVLVSQVNDDACKVFEREPFR